MSGFVLDSGALLALDRRAPYMLGILRETLLGRVELVIPRTVIAQVWRGAAQANLNRLIALAGRPGRPVVIDELTDRRARQIGTTIGRSSHPDIVDVHVAVVASELGLAVITSDQKDLVKVDPDLVIVRV